MIFISFFCEGEDFRNCFFVFFFSWGYATRFCHIAKNHLGFSRAICESQGLLRFAIWGFFEIITIYFRDCEIRERTLVADELHKSIATVCDLFSMMSLRIICSHTQRFLCNEISTKGTNQPIEFPMNWFQSFVFFATFLGY